uniref:Uncharacterized protein n=1 Tax=Oryzias sinensis TaxID=183150 RepID=A0A8C7XS93_9TELE
MTQKTTFHGISFPGHLHTQDSLQHAMKFQFQDTDILIVSYPKSVLSRWNKKTLPPHCDE